MITVQMTLDEPLVRMVDKVAKSLHTTRSAFTRQALQQAVERVKIVRLEGKHREGYVKHPVAADEFGVWAKEQKWGDE
jgi:metal-responsive CopG/Arc/MetJ family transcriptional regulator